MKSDPNGTARPVCSARCSTGQDALRHADLKKDTARDAYLRLEDRGDLERDDKDSVRYVDPLFERWVDALSAGGITALRL